jgi:ribosome maturation factor RimP
LDKKFLIFAELSEEGTKLFPLFVNMNISVEQSVKALLSRKFSEEGSKDLFLIETNWNPQSRKLTVFIDSDGSLTLAKCQEISRLIQGELRAYIKDPFQLDVSSPGLDRPLVSSRQYKKNIGRKVKVHLTNGVVMSGILRIAQDDRIGLEISNRSKGEKKNQLKLHEIDLQEISRTFVEISF